MYVVPNKCSTIVGLSFYIERRKGIKGLYKRLFLKSKPLANDGLLFLYLILLRVSVSYTHLTLPTIYSV